jgi:hypothetical protein
MTEKATNLQAAKFNDAARRGKMRPLAARLYAHLYAHLSAPPFSGVQSRLQRPPEIWNCLCGEMEGGGPAVGGRPLRPATT